MNAVAHDFFGKRAVFFEEFVVGIEEGDDGIFRELGLEEGVELLNLGAVGIVGAEATREDAHEDDFGAGGFFEQSFEDFVDGVGDLGGGVDGGFAFGEIVGADVDDDDFGLEAVEFTVLEAPEDVLGAIPAEAEIEDFFVFEDRVPSLWAARGDVGCGGFAAPEVGDGVADEDDFGLDLIFAGEDGLVALVPVVAIVFDFGEGDARGVFGGRGGSLGEERAEEGESRKGGKCVLREKFHGVKIQEFFGWIRKFFASGVDEVDLG